ncbi:MAG: hypothetical protein ABI378_08075 [Chitinophagaceae bacterium]
MENHWLIKKHRHNIEITTMSSKDFRWKINDETPFEMDSSENPYNAVFAWEKIVPSYGFFFDFVGIEELLPILLKNSSLQAHKTLLVETGSNVPIIKISTDYFVQHVIDFIDANQGMGSIIISEDLELLMEFTDDYKYYAFSNFSIQEKF